MCSFRAVCLCFLFIFITILSTVFGHEMNLVQAVTSIHSFFFFLIVSVISVRMGHIFINAVTGPCLKPK